MDLHERNQKIIDAIIRKADSACPGSLALIGLSGSFCTGDIHPKSDLDLLILINDERGWQLGETFIQDDLMVGHDLYCTTWDSLAADARYEQPHIAKLMDARIAYCADPQYAARLEALRQQARDILQAPLSLDDYKKAEGQLRLAEACCMNALTAANRPEMLRGAGGAVYYAENAVAMLNKRYFRKSVRRAYSELNAMERRPRMLCERIEAVVSAVTDEAVRENTLALIREVRACFNEARAALTVRKSRPTADALRGTYEEMVSNWRNKLHLAAETDDRHLAFMSMTGMNEMLLDIAGEADVGDIDVLGGYDPQDLDKTAQAFDGALEQYRRLYEQVGLRENRYPDADAFVRSYTG